MPTRAASLGIVALIVLGCAAPSTTVSSLASTPPPSVTPTATPASVPPSPITSRPAPTPTASAAPASFLALSSTVYPYSILLPEDMFQPGPVNVVPPPGTWKPARQVWDGTSVISPSVPAQNDSTIDGDGDELFVTGQPTDDDLDAFAARLVDDFGRWHGCSRSPATRQLEVDGEGAVMIASPCGPAFATRLFVVHEGFGLIFNTRTFRQVEADSQMNRLERYLADVDLRP